MTMKPKARKFRIKRPNTSVPLDKAPAADRAAPDKAAADKVAPEPVEPEVEEMADAARAGEVASAEEVDGENSIDAIRREGLTGRQLRMARRVAQKHGLAPTSDFDAVRLLRAQGIDPFQRSNMLELVVPNAGGDDAKLPAQQGTAAPKLPQTVPAEQNRLPSTEFSPAEQRVREISDIQRDITRRRQRKLALLLTRLAFFVFLPTVLAGWYYYKIATPMYATNSEFLIIQNEGSGGAGPLGGLLPTQFATGQDAIAVQGYLQSKAAMLRLDQDVGFKSHFENEGIDPIQRLNSGATNEEAYKTFKKNVKIGYDPTEGVIRMEVVAADPNVSVQFANGLISYAEENVNELSAKKRDDQMRDAQAGFDRAQANRREAQENLVRLQIEGSTLDPEGKIASLRAQISQLEIQVIDKEIELESLLNNARPNQSRVNGARNTLDIIKRQLELLNNKMTDASQGQNSLAELAARIQIAQADLASADLMLQSASQQLEQSRVEAARQVRILAVAVPPVASQEATYPRSFENTILAFLIFAGIYLMISLTASILREQVTS